MELGTSSAPLLMVARLARGSQPQLIATLRSLLHLSDLAKSLIGQTSWSVVAVGCRNMHPRRCGPGAGTASRRLCPPGANICRSLMKILPPAFPFVLARRLASLIAALVARRASAIVAKILHTAMAHLDSTRQRPHKVEQPSSAVELASLVARC
jgi:hypothetical protein